MPLLRAAVAYKLQERVHGGFKASTRNLLHRVADAADPARRAGLPVRQGQIRRQSGWQCRAR